MALNGIDISHWQSGIDLNAVPFDFCIMKATEGTYYVDSHCDRFYQVVKAKGAGRGVYHYANGGDPKQEADFFLTHCNGYIGDAVLCLDWEATGNPLFNSGQDTAWIKAWCDYVYTKTKVKPMVYTSKAYLGLVQGIGDYGLWIAQYADKSIVNGYQEKPWNEGAYTCAIRQYASTGRLPGYGGNLDLDKFYGDRGAWDAYVNGDRETNPQEAGEAINDFGLKYRAHVRNFGWLDWVHDGQVAGTVGQSKRLEAIQIDTGDTGLKLKATAHIQRDGTVNYGVITKNTIIGTTGQSKRLEALELEVVEGLPKGKNLYLQFHFAKDGWAARVKCEGGSFGLSKETQAVKMWVE